MRVETSTRAGRVALLVSVSVIGLGLLEVRVRLDAGTLLPQLTAAAALAKGGGHGNGGGNSGNGGGPDGAGPPGNGGPGNRGDDSDNGNVGGGAGGGGEGAGEGQGRGQFVVLPVLEGEPPATVESPPETLRYVVYFGFDDAKLEPDAVAVLREAQAAAGKLGGVVKVAGNADKAGADRYNQILSELRAYVVAKHMTAGGVPADAIRTSAFGESYLAVPTADGIPEPANRRVDIVIEPVK